MKLGQPRTLLGLILWGLALVTLPLLVAVGNALIQIDRVAGEAEVAVRESVQATELNQRLASLLRAMESNGRFWAATAEPTYLENYAEDHKLLATVIASLSQLPQDETTAGRLAVIGDTTRGVESRLRSPSISPEADQSIQSDFSFVNQAAQDVGRGMRRSMNLRLGELQAKAAKTQQTIGWQVAALVPALLLLAGLFVVFVGRPMRRLDGAISQLGQGQFDQPIAVKGPRDLEVLGRQLEWLRGRLVESTQEKNKFLRHMSHELKTPLANIREGTELLLDGSVGELDRQQFEVTSILRDNGLKLQKLIENLLTFSAWQTKSVSLQISEFDIKRLVFNVLGQHRLAISSKKLKLKLEVAPLEVSADEGKLRLVLENLTSNAIKFTPPNGVLYVAAKQVNNQLVIDVADTGPGVAAEDRTRIFEAFYQGRRPQDGEVSGTGIGLSVVSECAQVHGGKVALLDSDWPGAHFRVTLPLPKPAEMPMVAHG